MSVFCSQFFWADVDLLLVEPNNCALNKWQGKDKVVPVLN
jgi:hypothetical protein